MVQMCAVKVFMVQVCDIGEVCYRCAWHRCAMAQAHGTGVCSKGVSCIDEV